MPTSSAPFGITAGFAALTDLFASARFTDATRLYAFVSDGLPELLVESFCGIETVCGAVAPPLTHCSHWRATAMVHAGRLLVFGARQDCSQRRR